MTIKNTVIHDFVLYGLFATGASGLTIENNIMNGIRPDLKPYDEQKLLKFPSPNGGWQMVGANSYTFKNNTAASMWHSGFSLPSKKCGASSNIENNLAHSISGFGVIVFSGAGSCSEFSKFKGYKNGLATVNMGVSGKNLITDIVSVDSAFGINPMGSSGNPVEVRDNILYGSQDM